MIATEELIKKVRYLINETEDDVGVSLITDELRSIDDTIKKLLPQAVAIVQKQRNGRYVNAKALLPENAVIQMTADGFGTVVLPSDFAELVSIGLDSWKTPCVEISSSDSAEALYKFERSYRPASSEPVCVENITGEGNKELKFSPCGEQDSLSHFVYEAHFDIAEGLNMCDSRMADAVSYVCVALLYNVFERYDAAKSFMSFAAALCGGNGM